MKKFQNSDIFVNRIKAYPKVKIFLNNGKAYYNGEVNDGNVYFQDILRDPLDAISTESEIFLITQLGNILITEQDI